MSASTTAGTGTAGGTTGETGTAGTTPGAPVLNAPSMACRVPKLKGTTLATAKKRLAKAGCTAGRVRGRRGAKACVTSQTVKVVKAGTRVGVRLAIKR